MMAKNLFYPQQVKQQPRDCPQHPSGHSLICVDSRQFLTLTVDSDDMLAHYCRVHNLDPYLYVEILKLNQAPDVPINEIDVILMDKVNTCILICSWFS